MNYTFGFNETIGVMKRAPALINGVIERSLTECALLVQRTAIEGVRDTAGWMTKDWEKVELSPSTILGRMRRGMKSKADRPLWETATMVQSITIIESEKLREVGPTVLYALFHEKPEGGGPRPPKRPFMAPSRDKAQSEFEDIFRDNFKQLDFLK